MPFANQVIGNLGGQLNQPYPNPLQQGVLSSFFGGGGGGIPTPGPGMVGQQGQQMGGGGGADRMGGGGFFGQGQNFLQGLMSGQLPQSITDAAQRNLGLAQQNLNSQLQLRGNFFSTPGLNMQRQLSENMGTDLNNMVFQHAMSAIPQGMQLFGGAGNLASILSGLSPALQGSMGLLSGLHGQTTNPSFAPDPFTQIITSLLPLLIH